MGIIREKEIWGDDMKTISYQKKKKIQKPSNMKKFYILREYHCVFLTLAGWQRVDC